MEQNDVANQQQEQAHAQTETLPLISKSPKPTIQLRAITYDSYTAIREYLDSRPHKEVVNFIKVLDSAYVINAEIQNDKAGNQG